MATSVFDASKTDVLGIKAEMATKVDLANTKVEIIKWVAGMYEMPLRSANPILRPTRRC